MHKVRINIHVTAIQVKKLNICQNPKSPLEASF